MFVFIVEHKPDGALAEFGEKLVRRLAHDGSTFSGVEPSGKSSSVQDAITSQVRKAARNAIRGRPENSGRFTGHTRSPPLLGQFCKGTNISGADLVNNLTLHPIVIELKL
jgi:hypothetical protein